MKTWKTLKVSQALNRLLKVLIIAINAQSQSVDAPSTPGLGVEITALHTCSYPDWAIKKVKEQMNRKKAIEKINPRKIKHKKNQEEW